MTIRDNPMYSLLETRRSSVWDMGLVAAMLGSALLGLGTGPSVVSALFIILFALVRAGRDATRLASLVKGRGIEEVLMARTSVYELLDGACLHCLRRSVGPGFVFWLWVIGLQLVAGQTARLVWMLAAWLPILALTLVSCSYMTQLSATGRMGRSPVPTVLAILWAGLLVAEFTVLATGEYRYALGFLVGMLLLAGLARRYTGAALMASLTPARSVVRVRGAYQPWGELEPVELREACREHHRGQLWTGWAALCGWTSLAVYLGEGGATMFFLLIPTFTLWAAHRTNPSIIQEREARTFDVIALTQLRSEQFVDGWARHGWRLLTWQALVPTTGVAWLAARNSWNHKWVAFSAFYLAMLIVAAQLGSYIGIWASARAASRESISGQTFGGCVLAFFGFLAGCIVLGFLNPQVLRAWPWLAAMALAATFRADTLSRLTVDPGRAPATWAPGLVLLLPLPLGPASWLVVLAFLVVLHRQVRSLPGWMLILSVLLGGGVTLSATGLPNFGLHTRGQLTACASKNIGTALAMDVSDNAGLHPRTNWALPAQ